MAIEVGLKYMSWLWLLFSSANVMYVEARRSCNLIIIGDEGYSRSQSGIDVRMRKNEYSNMASIS